MGAPESVFILKSKYDDEDSEIAGVYDSFNSLLEGFSRILKMNPVYAPPSDGELDNLRRDLSGNGPDDECNFHGCVFSWEERRVHCKEEFNGKA